MNDTREKSLDETIDELRSYKAGGGKIPPALIDRVIGLLSQQRLHIANLEENKIK